MPDPSSRPRRPPAVLNDAGRGKLLERLRAHLETELDAADVARVVAAIAEWLLFGPSSAGEEAQAERAARHEHFARIAELARDLLDALRLERPTWATKGIDWDSLDSTLERVRASAEAEAPAEKRPRNAPPAQWRDGLVALIETHYPAGKVRVHRGSHFERTVEIVLEHLGAGLADLHRQILRSRRRKALPPFMLHLLD